ncbi:YtxH domain-containing protein [Pseudoramibacter sp. HA2172]|uniref:YtxH domain-containing protein n=1 Tax=Pseudoramibacter faecis TaxID=3108534 RepID=UPI002E7A5D1B|nr:YtxH domain-containing protein [Pseudoramibacter sp. HA2172]
MANKEGYFIGGLFAGAMIGAAAALLLAPASGEEIRENLQEHIRGTFGDVHDQALEYTESLKGQIQDAADTLTDRVNQYKAQIEDKIEEIQDDVSASIDELNDELEAIKAEDEEMPEAEAEDDGEPA